MSYSTVMTILEKVRGELMEERKAEAEKKQEVLFAITKDNLWKILAAVLAIALVMVLFKGKLFGGSPSVQNQVQLPSTPPVPGQPTKAVAVSIDDDSVKGDAQAKVMLIEFSDYQCPYCGRLFSETMPSINEQYIKTGKAAFVLRDFPLSFHQYAQKASEAAECASDQHKYWEYHDKLFENQQSLDIASLKEYAKDLGLDTVAFDNCLDSGKQADEVKKDFADGQKAGVSGTPAVFVNGKLISGACPFGTFQQAIDAELAGKQWSVDRCQFASY